MKRDWMGRLVEQPPEPEFSSALEAAQHYLDFVLWPTESLGKVDRIVVQNPPRLRIEIHCANGVVVEIPREHPFFHVMGKVLHREIQTSAQVVAEIKRQARLEELS